jgi:hypothetical protein
MNLKRNNWLAVERGMRLFFQRQRAGFARVIFRQNRRISLKLTEALMPLLFKSQPLFVVLNTTQKVVSQLTDKFRRLAVESCYE